MPSRFSVISVLTLALLVGVLFTVAADSAQIQRDPVLTALAAQPDVANVRASASGAVTVCLAVAPGLYADITFASAPTRRELDAARAGYLAALRDAAATREDHAQ